MDKSKIIYTYITPIIIGIMCSFGSLVIGHIIKNLPPVIASSNVSYVVFSALIVFAGMFLMVIILIVLGYIITRFIPVPKFITDIQREKDRHASLILIVVTTVITIIVLLF